MRSLAPPPRPLHSFRRQPKTPYKRLFTGRVEDLGAVGYAGKVEAGRDELR